jgi:DNA-binding response OmpR family regulator
VTQVTKVREKGIKAIMRILVVEDDEQNAEVLSKGLEMESYAVDIASTGEEGENLAESTPYDLIILDLILPNKDGIEVCRSLRRKNIKTPLLMLTCKNTVEDRALGLDSGADDYLGKPFSLIEVSARVRALLRRERNVTSARIQIGDLVLDTANRLVWWGQKNIDLTAKELAVLEYLAYNLDTIVTRNMIEEHVWNGELDFDSNLVDVYISRLRAKIDPGNKKELIQTIKGLGYILKTTP